MSMVSSAVLLAAEFTSPGPIAFHLGPIVVRWYGILIASAVLLGVSLSQKLASKQNIDPELINDLAIWLVVGALPCARLYYVLFQWKDYAANPSKAIAIWEGGIAIHGAIIGGTIAALIFAKLRQISFWRLADIVAPALILGQAIGRWGNFFNSEAYGAPTDLPWKLLIPLSQRPPGLETVAYYHPTFLYESLWNLMVFGILMTLVIRDRQGHLNLRSGTIFLAYAIFYSLGRVWIEGLRMDSLMWGPLKMAQMVSLAGVLLGIAGLAWLYGVKRSLPDVAAPDSVPTVSE
ncbi:MAG: prolipoprotein diacylglyceryl transferase [Alkalinema sp. CACIAM 70d]|nr:MAG: prolipoprotein diacylglyceryl transferase [Alkalinema sp. CACIAM 70d]